jgi:hypothetical protein
MIRLQLSADTLKPDTFCSRVLAREERLPAAPDISSEEVNVSFVTTEIWFMSLVIPFVVALISSMAVAI